MRWDDLFADLEAQLAAADDAALAADVEQRLRRELGRQALVQRLRAAAGTDVVLGVGDEVLHGRLGAVGPDWVLLTGPAETLVPVAALDWTQGLGRAVDAVPPGRVWSRLGLASALRALGRDRSPLRVRTAAPGALAGTIDRVGADHLDLAVHPLDAPRRATAVTAVRTIPFAALRTLVRADAG